MNLFFYGLPFISDFHNGVCCVQLPLVLSIDFIVYSSPEFDIWEHQHLPSQHGTLISLNITPHYCELK